MDLLLHVPWYSSRNPFETRCCLAWTKAWIPNRYLSPVHYNIFSSHFYLPNEKENKKRLKKQKIYSCVLSETQRLPVSDAHIFAFCAILCEVVKQGEFSTNHRQTWYHVHPETCYFLLSVNFVLSRNMSSGIVWACRMSMRSLCTLLPWSPTVLCRLHYFTRKLIFSSKVNRINFQHPDALVPSRLLFHLLSHSTYSDPRFFENFQNLQILHYIPCHHVTTSFFLQRNTLCFVRNMASEMYVSLFMLPLTYLPLPMYRTTGWLADLGFSGLVQFYILSILVCFSTNFRSEKQVSWR